VLEQADCKDNLKCRLFFCSSYSGRRIERTGLDGAGQTVLKLLVDVEAREVAAAVVVIIVVVVVVSAVVQILHLQQPLL